MRLQGKVGIITGGGKGIGAATARMFTGEGAKVVIADVDDTAGEALVRDLREGGADAVFVHMDVTKETDWKHVVAETLKAFGRVDILVNNAGIGGRRGQGVSDLDTWHQVMAVNATAPFVGIQSVLDPMKKQGGGSIINISSIYGIVGPNRAGRQQPEDGITGAYNASKGSIRLLTKASALQLAKYNVRVNSVHPGFIDTPLTAQAFSDPETKEFLSSLHPIGRLGKPEDIANAITYLASDESSFVTGSEVVVDGGYTAQ
jgi:NAD(P)-dependent dehydrogenase (short-subunit alcohol dehydrogenase family)